MRDPLQQPLNYSIGVEHRQRPTKPDKNIVTRTKKKSFFGGALRELDREIVLSGEGYNKLYLVPGTGYITAYARGCSRVGATIRSQGFLAILKNRCFLLLVGPFYIWYNTVAHTVPGIIM